MYQSFRFIPLFATALAWNAAAAVGVVLVARSHHAWSAGDLVAAMCFSALVTVIGSCGHAAGARFASGWVAKQARLGAREIASAPATFSYAFWPVGLLVTPIIALMIVLGPDWLSGLGAALALAPGLVIGVVAMPVRVAGRLLRLRARRVLDEVREAYPPDGLCEDCGLPIARQSPRLAPLHPLAWLIPSGCVLAVVVGMATLVALTLPGSGGMNGVTIWWSWRGAALLALPVYLVLVGSWMLPRWIILRPIRFTRTRRLALGTCVLCEHGLLGKRPG